FFFFQAEDGIRDRNVTGVQTCALPISNLALALTIDPQLPKLFERLFIMGGAFNYRGNTRPTTEWNVTFAPEAAARVLSEFGTAHEAADLDRLPVIAPIEATAAVDMPSERLTARRAGAAETARSRQAMLAQLSEALRFYFEFHESDGLGYLAHIHDPFVLACALEWARHDRSGPASSGIHGQPGAASAVGNGSSGALPW